jgi:hypothetical protein
MSTVRNLNYQKIPAKFSPDIFCYFLEGIKLRYHYEDLARLLI